MSETYRESIERAISKAAPRTPTTIESGRSVLMSRSTWETAGDFARTARRTMLDGYSEADAVAAHWWAYDPELA